MGMFKGHKCIFLISTAKEEDRRLRVSVLCKKRAPISHLISKTVPSNPIHCAILVYGFWFIKLRSEKKNVFKDLIWFFSQEGSSLTS